MQQLIKQIKEWGVKRGIDQCDPLFQTTKTEEEIIELKRAIIRHEDIKSKYPNNVQLEDGRGSLVNSDDLQEFYKLEIKDAIGDIFITLVMLDLQIHGTEDMPLRNLNYQGVFGPFENALFMSNIIRQIQGKLLRKEGGYFFDFEYIVSELSATAICYNLTLKECVEYAYNEIKDRQGKIVAGLWNKIENLPKEVQ